MHRFVKWALGKSRKNAGIKLFYVYFEQKNIAVINETVRPLLINAQKPSPHANCLFYGENTLESVHLSIKNEALEVPCFKDKLHAREAWWEMIRAVRVPSGFCNSGLYLTGYTLEKKQWVLSSWIWTSAAVARYLYSTGEIKSLELLADTFLQHQLDFGGWRVRFDIARDGVLPNAAPNDSAYIARNALLNAYKIFGRKNYLDAAIRCAQWIMNTAREDGLVHIGLDLRSHSWIKNVNIVDIGFTMDFFAQLYSITGNEAFSTFLVRFLKSYIRYFYNEQKCLFSTSIDENNKQIGGFFARGQGWALEGLISSWKIIKSSQLGEIIDQLCSRLVALQLPNGGWPYNFSKPYLGEDCKGVAVLAYHLMEWYGITGKQLLLSSAKAAIAWCETHTQMEGPCRGGIFSFSAEGAIAHSFYSSTAFTYATCYALETIKKIEEADDLYQ